MKFFDYIFYRLYKEYDSKRDLPLFSSIIVISCNIFLINYPFLGLLCDMLENKVFDKTTEALFYLDAIIIVLFVTHRYCNKEKRNYIFQKYKNSVWNKTPAFCYYFVWYLVDAIWGIGGYIILCKYIIDPLKLEGIIYRGILELISK